MSLVDDAKNALALLIRGEWHELVFRVRVHLQKIDLKNSYLEELHLSEERCHYYANSGGFQLAQLLRALDITPEDSVVDFGSGKGGALITLSRFPFSRIMGVEIAPELVDIARQNLHKLGIGRVSMIVADAAEVTEVDAYNYFYFFNPFPAAVMTTVIKNISLSLARKPRKAVIIYFNPEFHHAVISGSPFVKTREFNHHQLSYFLYSNRP
jgi:SAM-dependent methyltransferase